MAYDLLIEGGTIIDPSQGLNGEGSVAISDGRIVECFSLESRRPATDQPTERLDATGCIVVPGLIDLHTHVYWGANLVSIEADDHMASMGTTTWVDVGTSGGANFAGFRRHVIEPARARILAFLNISAPGLTKLDGPCHEEIRDMDVDLVCETAAANSDLIKGVKVLASGPKVGKSGLLPVQLAREAGEAAGLPVMCHIGLPPPGLLAVLPVMRSGDIITHTYKGRAGCLVVAGDKVRPEAWEARERGVLFDVGHGYGSFSWRVARAALEQGFPPDSISTDLHVRSLDSCAYSMPSVMSKFMHLGMSLEDVIRLSTDGPAGLLGMEGEIGTLKPGACADVAVLEIEDGAFPIEDCEGLVETMDRRLTVAATVRAGAVQLVRAPSDPRQ